MELIRIKSLEKKYKTGVTAIYDFNLKVKKGDEKGYFKFGGSTTILFFKKDMVSIDDDILLQSSFGFESKVNMGEKIGEKLK